MKIFERKWPAVLLLPLSLLYALIMSLRNAFYDWGILPSFRVDCPVISVGNITVGGTGKTPTVQYIVRKLQSMDKRVAVISRGYQRLTHGYVLVADGEKVVATALEAGDEPYLVAKSNPGTIVAVDENRVRAAKIVVEKFRPDVIVLDDAYQHRRLSRDLDIVLLRGEMPFGNGFVLPAGPLRETRRGLKRADFILCNGQMDKGKMPKFTGKIPQLCLQYEITSVRNRSGKVPLDAINGQPAIAFCGIGHPASFRATLKKLYVNISRFLTFQDHYRYSADDLKEIEKLRIETNAKYIITTEKDWVKIAKEDLPSHWLYVKVGAYFDEEKKIVSRFEMLF